LVRVERPSGSIDSVGNDFQPFRINDLELVDLNSVSWNHVATWLHQLAALRSAPSDVTEA
jgi:hypothetical protein